MTGTATTLISVKAKRGRKQKPYITSWGEIIVGLQHRASDGRWQVTGGRTFTEPDERRAIEHFRQIIGHITDEQRETAEALERNMYRHEREKMKWFAEQLRSRPQWLAERTGVEELGYLPTLRPPEKLPSLEELAKVYEKNATCSPDQIHKNLRAWRDFVARAGITHVNFTVVAAADDRNCTLIFRSNATRSI